MGWDRQQTQFVQSLLDPAKGVPDFVTRTAGEPSSKRFNVYRNNVMVSLTQALLDSYPVVAQLVGDDFATAMARVYAGINLPDSPVLLEYGATYGYFINGFEPAQGLPYLHDIARLEWAFLQAYHSADQTPLAIDALAEFGEDEFTNLQMEFCPAVFLYNSDFPIVSIWSAHQESDKASDEKEADTDLKHIKQSGECALVTRPDLEVEMRVIDQGTHAFLDCLQYDLPLGKSIDKGATFKGFDPAQALELMFTSGCVAKIKKN